MEEPLSKASDVKRSVKGERKNMLKEMRKERITV